MNITELKSTYENSAQASMEQGIKLADTISMLEIESVKSTIADAVVQIESLTNKANSKSVLAKLPFMGKYFDKAQENIRNNKLQNGSMVEAVERLFNSLKNKKDEVEGIVDTLFGLREKLMKENVVLEEIEGHTKQIIEEDPNSKDGFHARNLMVQVQKSLIRGKDRVGIIDATINSAEVCANQICTMLPSLQGELITELTIQQSLGSLKEYKQMFDATIEVLDNINSQNEESMHDVLRDVVQLTVVNPSKSTMLALQNNNAKRTKLLEDISNDLANAKKEQDKTLQVLQDTRNNQVLLEVK